MTLTLRLINACKMTKNSLVQNNSMWMQLSGPGEICASLCQCPDQLPHMQLLQPCTCFRARSLLDRGAALLTWGYRHNLTGWPFALGGGCLPA